MKTDELTYLLRLSGEHAAALSTACEVYHRAAMGQWRIVVDHFEGKNADWQWQREQGLDQVADQLQRILCPGLSPGGGYGYGSEQTGRTGQLIFEVKQRLDHRRYWTEEGIPQDSHRDYHEPMLFPSPVTPKPECAAESGNQPELAVHPMKLAKEIEEILYPDGFTDLRDGVKRLKQWKKAYEREVKRGGKEV